MLGGLGIALSRLMPSITVENEIPRVVWALGSKKTSPERTFCEWAFWKYAVARS